MKTLCSPPPKTNFQVLLQAEPLLELVQRHLPQALPWFLSSEQSIKSTLDYHSIKKGVIGERW